MKIVLNGSTVCDDDKTTALLRLASIMQEIERNSLLVRSFKIDGVDCAYTYDGGLASYIGVDLVELMVCSSSELLQEAVADAREYLPRLTGGLRRVAEHFVAGREGEGVNTFLQAMDGLNWLEQFSGAVAAGGLACLPDGFMDRLGEHRNRLADLLAAWENRDYLLIGDILDYEIAPYLEYYVEQLASLKDALSGEKKDCWK